MGFASPETQFSAGRSNGLDRPPPHSLHAIRAKRAGGKKVPKKYRKYHQNTKTTKNKKPAGHIFSRAVHYVINAVSRILP